MVIPKFIKLTMADKEQVIYEDGCQYRDFIFAEKSVWANIQACTAQKTTAIEEAIRCVRTLWKLGDE